MGVTNPKKPRPRKIPNNDGTWFYMDCDDPFEVGKPIYNFIGSEGADLSSTNLANVSAGTYYLLGGQSYTVIINNGQSEIHTIS